MQKDDTHKEKTKLILYKKVNEKKNLFYFNNEENEQNMGKPLKKGNASFKNSNNLLINNMKNNNNKNNNINKNQNSNNNNNKTNNINNKSQTDNITDNNKISKKTSMINYVSKDDKSKNLFVFKEDNNISNFNMINQNKGKESKYNRYYDNNERLKEEKLNIFNIQKLKKKNANEVKIIPDKKYELPISNVCYFSKFNIVTETRFKLPISSRCYFNKSIIFNKGKIKLPISNICYLNKSTIIKEEKIMHTIINNYYFCTKENKINDKNGKSLIIENCIGFNCLRTIKIRRRKFGNNFLNKAKTKNQNDNENNNEIKLFKYQPKSKKEDKKNDAKFKEYKKKINVRLRNYKTIKHEDIMKKLNNQEKNVNNIKYGNNITFNRENNSERKNKNKNIKKIISIKDSLNKYSNSLSKKNIKKYVISKTENENNSSISFHDSNNNNLGKCSFYNIFDINNKNTKNKNKIILQRFMENGQIKNNRNTIKEKEKKNENKNNNVIIPNIFDNINKKSPKSKTIFNTQSSRYLIKKINSTSFKNRNNNNSLFKITKNPNCLFSMDTNTIDNQNCLFKYQKRNNNNNDLPGLLNNKNSEEINQCNHGKYDKHFGNENNCPKCQSMDMKINYIKDKSNQVIPKINTYQVNNNNFNKTFDNFKRNNFIIPLKYFEKLYLKNYNNYRNNSKNLLSKLQRNNSGIQIKKLKISKYSKDMLNNYKSSVLAIKEYFNIK